MRLVISAAHRAQARVVGVQQALQLAEVARGEQRQMIADQLQRLGAERRGLGQRLQLQREAFGGVARADARRLEALQVLERDRKLVRSIPSSSGNSSSNSSSEVVR